MDKIDMRIDKTKPLIVLKHCKGCGSTYNIVGNKSCPKCEIFSRVSHKIEGRA